MLDVEAPGRPEGVLPGRPHQQGGQAGCHRSCRQEYVEKKY